jgi:hypothetical protein
VQIKLKIQTPLRLSSQSLRLGTKGEDLRLGVVGQTRVCMFLRRHTGVGNIYFRAGFKGIPNCTPC